MLLKIINKERKSEIKKKNKSDFLENMYKYIGRRKSLVQSFDNLYLIVSFISI